MEEAADLLEDGPTVDVRAPGMEKALSDIALQLDRNMVLSGIKTATGPGEHVAPSRAWKAPERMPLRRA